jgi:signal transduction histidine kinase
MDGAAIAMEPGGSATEEDTRRLARRWANQRIAFIGHFLVWLTTSCFLSAVAGATVSVIVALAWAIGLVCHGFFGVIAPRLRQRWVTSEVDSRLSGHVSDTKRALHDAHVRSVASLSAEIAHEIRNPVTAAKSLVQQIGEDPRSEENVEYARIAAEELDRVERAVSHLLRFAREQDVRVSDVDVNDVVRSATDVLRDRIDGSGTRLEIDLRADGAMRGDGDKLRQLVVNLVGNALDAVAGREGGRVAIATGNDLGGRETWIRVHDDGPGIPPDALPKIWSPFFSAKEGGTGLGLAISRKIAEAHGGTIEARSAPSEGTEMLVTFPRR